MYEKVLKMQLGRYFSKSICGLYGFNTGVQNIIFVSSRIQPEVANNIPAPSHTHITSVKSNTKPIIHTIPVLVCDIYGGSCQDDSGAHSATAEVCHVVLQCPGLQLDHLKIKYSNRVLFNVENMYATSSILSNQHFFIHSFEIL